LIISKGHIEEGFLLDIALDLARALEEIHKKGIIHRDVKLRNSIYCPESGKVKLCDFGIAQLPDLQNLTQQGVIVGTPIYMAPENLRGSRATRQSDIYSYGATIYHLATNTPPFVAKNHAELSSQHFSKLPTPIEKIRPRLSKKWTELIVKRCLARKPEDRPQSMTEVIKSLHELAEEI